MALRKKPTSSVKRRPYRKRGGYLGARRRYRLSRVHNYTQMYYKTSAFQLTDTSDFLNTFAFTLNGAGGNVPAFINIYDMYRINRITIKFIPKFNMMTSNVSSSVNFASVIDVNDNNNLGSINQAWEYHTCKMTRGSSIHTRSFKPGANLVVDGTTGGVSTRLSPWIATSNATIPHYGVKCAVPQLPSGADPLDFDLQVKYDISFKNVK